MARKSKAKPKKKDKEPSAKVVGLVCVLCGVFAIGFGVLEGFVFKSTGVYTGPSGTFMMDPITSTLFILGGLVGVGFGIWTWLNPDKKL